MSDEENGEISKFQRNGDITNRAKTEDQDLLQGENTLILF